MTTNKPQVICYGEVLWDCFPDHTRLGGAPLNVALRLHDLGVATGMISSVGSDQLGRQTLKQIADRGFNLQGIQTHASYPTGKVAVTLDHHGSPAYQIQAPAAWDFINYTTEAQKLVKQAQFLVYGSLVGREKVSLQTLNQLLLDANYKVFDINLRAPFYTRELIRALMQTADAIKLNDEELELVCQWLDIVPQASLAQNLKQIAQKTNTQLICVTLGAQGAAVLDRDEFCQVSGYRVKVNDTVGAGDSFLASFIAKYLVDKNKLEDSLKYACAMGALVASKSGATAAVDANELNQLLQQQ